MKSVFLTIILILCFVAAGVFFGSKLTHNGRISSLTKAIEQNPDQTDLYFRRGDIYYLKGTYDLAIADFIKATELDPNFYYAYNGLGWLYATCPDAKYRDGQKAISFAHKALDLNYNEMVLDTLAAAYAEAGHFKDAVATQEEAIELLKKNDRSESDDLADYEKRLKAYQNNFPWRSTR